jgi:hypothetical protein
MPLERGLELDLACFPDCGGELKIAAAILEQPVIAKTLTAWVCVARANCRP